MILKVNGTDITTLTGGISLDSNTDTLGDQFNFNMAYSAPHLIKEVNVGDLVQVYGGEEVFRGIVITKTRSKNTQDFACFDFAFYLNKSKILKQFNKIRADTAIKQLLTEFNVPIGNISPMATIINKIYYDKEVSEVIKDILTEVTNATGKKYVMEMNAGKLDIYPDTEKIITATVKLADNLPPINCMNTISDPAKTASIEEMKNSIKLYVNNDDKIKTVAEVKNDWLIGKYGLLQEVQSLEDKDIAQAKNIAQNLLKQLGKVSVEAGITVLGSFKLRAGRVVEVNEPITNIVGKYKIKSARHSIGAQHLTTLELIEI